MPELEDIRTLVPITASQMSADDMHVVYDASTNTVKSFLHSEFGDIIGGTGDVASSAIQAFDDDTPHTVLYRDLMEGDSETEVAAGTRTMVPGPGVWTVGAASNQSYARWEGRVMRMTNLPFATGYVQVNGPATTLAAGMAMRVRLVPSFQPGYVYAKSKLGFAHTTINAPARRGVISFEKLNVENHIRVWISGGTSNTDDSLYNAGYGVVLPNEETEVVVFHRTLQHQEYFIKTPRSGHQVGTERWFKLGETFMDLTGGLTVYPFVSHEHSGVTEIREVTVYSNWSPSPRANLFDYSRTLQGVHIPTLARDPVSELPILAWNSGLTHVGEGLSAIRTSVRLASGAWTTPATLLAAPTAPEGQCVNSLSNVKGVLWMVYWRSATGTDGGTLYRRTVAINSVSGAVTLGSEVSLGISGTLNLNFSPIITLASGRLLLPFHKGADGSPQYNQYAAYSDDSGITWTVGVIASSIPGGMNKLVEGSLVVESDGAVGIYMRNSSGSIAYSRCALPNAATLSWSTPTSISAVPNPDSRFIVTKLSDGQILLIGNNSKVYRRDVTIWNMGDSGVLLGETFIADWNPVDATSSTSQLAYPTLLEDDHDLIIAWTQQESGGGNLAVGIRQMTMRWTQPVSIDAGGTGRRNQPRATEARPMPSVTTIPYSTTPTPDLTKGSSNFALTLTASTATVGVPLTPMGFETIRLIVTQGGVGSFTLAFNAIYEMNGTTPTLQTAAGASNIFVFLFNPASQKWVLQSFN